MAYGEYGILNPNGTKYQSGWRLLLTSDPK